MAEEIRARTFRFALEVIQCTRTLPRSYINVILIRQLLRAATSVGANVEEAAAACSQRDFMYRVGVALRESRETCYWMKLFNESGEIESAPFTGLLDEAEQITKILGAVVSNMRRKAGSNTGTHF